MEVPFALYPVTLLFEKFNDTQDTNSIKVRKNFEIVDITTKLKPKIADPIDFRIEDGICVNNDRDADSTNSKSIDWKAEFRENPVDTYSCSANETVLVNTSCENEFVSVAPGEKLGPESLTNDISY